MKTIILCFPALDWEQIQMPIGLYKIAAYCKQYYNVIIVDDRLQKAESAIKELICKEDVVFLGISVMIGSQITKALHLSKLFHGEVPIVWGGTLPTILPEMVLESEYVDYIIRGDGEAAILDLANALVNQSEHVSSNTKVHVFQDLSMSNINYATVSLPDEYFISRDGFSRAIALETSRGCPHACAFCHNTSLKHPYRYIPAEIVKNSIAQLVNRFHIDGIIFQEDNMFVNTQRAIDILSYLKGLPEVGWKANSRIDYFKKLSHNQTFMELLVESGCHTLQFGIESGSPQILKMINKRIIPEDVIEVNKALAQYNIRLRFNFIIGFPTETESEIHETMQLATQLQSDNPHAEPPFVNIYTPIPGTPLFDAAIKDGFVAPCNLEEWADIYWNRIDELRWPRKTNPLINRLSMDALERSFYLKASCEEDKK